MPVMRRSRAYKGITSFGWLGLIASKINMTLGPIGSQTSRLKQQNLPLIGRTSQQVVCSTRRAGQVPVAQTSGPGHLLLFAYSCLLSTVWQGICAIKLRAYPVSVSARLGVIEVKEQVSAS
jgi:hypothetical protein